MIYVDITVSRRDIVSVKLRKKYFLQIFDIRKRIIEDQKLRDKCRSLYQN